jgi:hypothetical protein
MQLPKCRLPAGIGHRREPTVIPVARLKWTGIDWHTMRRRIMMHGDGTLHLQARYISQDRLGKLNIIFN